ncbi:MAG: hypothetical protein N4A33_02680 [Bacteriovoracaceae bacterium]|jgi:hypothetical protein|nr:hypothetical protein [Bacteriovoracaceae bacterium]
MSGKIILCTTNHLDSYELSYHLNCLLEGKSNIELALIGCYMPKGISKDTVIEANDRKKELLFSNLNDVAIKIKNDIRLKDIFHDISIKVSLGSPVNVLSQYLTDNDVSHLILKKVNYDTAFFTIKNLSEKNMNLPITLLSIKQ